MVPSEFTLFPRFLERSPELVYHANDFCFPSEKDEYPSVRELPVDLANLSKSRIFYNPEGAANLVQHTLYSLHRKAINATGVFNLP